MAQSLTEAADQGEHHALVEWPDLVIGLNHLLARCDGAFAEDGMGFSKAHAGPARRLSRISAYWTEAEAQSAADILIRYRRQLSDAGLYEGVADWRNGQKARRVAMYGDLAPVRWDRVHGALVINLDVRDEEARAMVRAIPGRRWDPDAKLWRIVPGADTTPAIRAALASSRLTVPEEVGQRLDAAAQADSHGWVVPQPDGQVLVSAEETYRRHLSAWAPEASDRATLAAVTRSPAEVAEANASLASLKLLDSDSLSLAIRPLEAGAVPPALAVDPEDWDGVRFEGGQFRIRRQPYDPGLVAAIKDLPARRWSPDAKEWSVPVTADSWPQLQEIIARFSLDIDDYAREHGEALARTAEALERGSTAAAPAEVSVPGLAVDLLPFQSSGVDYAVKARRTFIADEMGLGKTIQALATAGALGVDRTLVICPASLRLNWAREVKHCFPNWQPVVVTHTGPTAVADAVRLADPKRGPVVVIAGYPLLQNAQKLDAHLDAFADWDPDALICDESHSLKTSAKHTNRTKAAIQISKEIRKRHPDAPLLLLSGTPMLNAPKDLIAQLQVLGRLDDFGGWHGFAKNYCGLHYEIGRGGREHPVYDGCTKPAELNRKLRATCMVRRRKDMVLPELGDLLDASRPPIYVETDPKAMEAYREVEKDISAYLAQRAAEIAKDMGVAVTSSAVASKLQGLEAAKSLVQLNKLRQLAAEAKVPAVIDWLGDTLESSQTEAMDILDGRAHGDGGKVIVFAHHQQIVKQIADAFSAPMISGLEGDQAERQAVVDRFQTDPNTRLLVCSFGAGSEGITLTKASQVVFVELPWRPMDIDQAVARAWRIGQTQTVTPSYLLAEDTVDGDMLDLLRTKEASFDSVIEGGTPSRKQARSVEGELIVRLARRARAGSAPARAVVDAPQAFGTPPVRSPRTPPPMQRALPIPLHVQDLGPLEAPVNAVEPPLPMGPSEVAASSRPLAPTGTMQPRRVKPRVPYQRSLF